MIHRNLRQTPPTAVCAFGMYLRDSKGNTYLDASGGAAVSSLGHSHPDVLSAMAAQMKTTAYAHSGFFTTEVAEELAQRLATDAPGDLNNVYLVSGGSEAVESALKMARQYFVENGEHERRVFIARQQSFHGNTLGALALGGNEARRKQFEPLLMDVARVSPCYEYRHRPAGQDVN
jgi:adenosylmethionine-8-amino-7-oxononanoate aminotransferase